MTEVHIPNHQLIDNSRNDHAGVVLRALRKLLPLNIPLDGGLRVRKLLRAIQEHLEDVESLRMDTLKTLAVLDENGSFVYVVDDAGKATNSVQFKDTEAAMQFAAFYNELMQKTFDTDLTFTREHIQNEQHVWQGKAEILTELGDLLEDE